MCSSPEAEFTLLSYVYTDNNYSKHYKLTPLTSLENTL